MGQLDLWTWVRREYRITPARDAADLLRDRHYLGPARTGVALWHVYGVMIFAPPTSRRLPRGAWLELTRWCITSREDNAGSAMWAVAAKWLRQQYPEVTTIVSYSDPSVGHGGALYRACNWWWAPTWHRVVTPPTGNGSWTEGKVESVKDRWVFPLRKDAGRATLLRVEPTYARRFPWSEYREPGGADYRGFTRWREARG